MKILLVGINAKYVHTNIAVRYIKSYCSEFNISISEYTINDTMDRILEGIFEQKPDIAGFSCYIWNIDIVLKLCDSLKKILPALKIVLGGPEVSYDSREIMFHNSCIDFIIKGEGEITSRNLFGFLQHNQGNLQDIKGIVYRDRENIVDNGEPEVIRNQDSLPFPYNEDEDISNKIIYYESSRGCPFKCSYCLSSTIEGVRFFSLDRVKKDLFWFINHDVRLVKFVDRTFNCSRHFIDILKFIVENNKATRFHMEIAGDLLDEMAIEFLKTIPYGMLQFEIGVQSTNENVLKFINRRMDFKRLSMNIKALRESGNIPLHLDLIAGLPGEDFESFSRSFNHVMELKPHVLQLGFLKLLKGSSMREDVEKWGMAYRHYPPYEILKTDRLSFEELSHLKQIEDVVERYYNSGRYRATIKYLVAIFEDNFSLFENISDYKKKAWKNKADSGNAEQYKLLMDFCKYKDIKKLEFIRECLSFDYLMQGRNPVMPDFLSSEFKIDKEYIKSLFSKEENIEKYISHYKGEDYKSIIKKLHGRIFTYDIGAFMDSENIIKKQTYIFFDYGYKDGDKDIHYFTI